MTPYPTYDAQAVNATISDSLVVVWWREDNGSCEPVPVKRNPVRDAVAATREKAREDLANSGLTVNIFGTNTSDATSIGNALDWWNPDDEDEDV